MCGMNFACVCFWLCLSSGTSSNQDKPKKAALPMFGAMKGGSKFKLKTGTIGVRGVLAVYQFY